MNPTALILVLDAAILASIGAQPDLPDDFGRRGDIGASVVTPCLNLLGGDPEAALEPQQGPDANDSHPSTRIVADPAVVRLFISCADMAPVPFSCPPCDRLKAAEERGEFAGFAIEYVIPFDGQRAYPAIRYPDARSRTGWAVMYGFDGKTIQALREKTSTKRFVSQSRNTNPVVSHNDLVSMHNRLHGGGQWTWPGDLATHLQNTHGVNLTGGAPITGAMFPSQRASAVTSQRLSFRSLPRRTTFVGRSNYLSPKSCPTCPR